MKKFFALMLVLVMALSLSACGSEPKVETVDPTDTEKQVVIDALKKFFDSDTYKNAVSLYETASGNTAETPELLNVFTLKHDDVYGYAVDLVLANVKTWCAVEENGETMIFDKVQFIVDNKTGNVYESMTRQEWLNNFTGNVTCEEDAIVMFLNSGVLMEGGDDWLWSENETSTRYSGTGLEDIAAAVLG